MGVSSCAKKTQGDRDLRSSLGWALLCCTRHAGALGKASARPQSPHPSGRGRLDCWAGGLPGMSEPWKQLGPGLCKLHLLDSSGLGSRLHLSGASWASHWLCLTQSTGWGMCMNTREQKPPGQGFLGLEESRPASWAQSPISLAFHGECSRLPPLVLSGAATYWGVLGPMELMSFFPQQPLLICHLSLFSGPPRVA